MFIYIHIYIYIYIYICWTDYLPRSRHINKYKIYIYTTTTDHHHTVQVARAQVEYVRQWVEGKRPPAQVATGDTTTGARSVCING